MRQSSMKYPEPGTVSNLGINEASHCYAQKSPFWELDWAELFRVICVFLMLFLLAHLATLCGYYLLKYLPHTLNSLRAGTLPFQLSNTSCQHTAWYT